MTKLSQKELSRYGLKICRQLDTCRDRSINIKEKIIHLFTQNEFKTQPAELRTDIEHELYRMNRQIKFIEIQINEFKNLMITVCTKDDPYHLKLAEHFMDHKYNRLVQKHESNLKLAYSKLLITTN